MKIPELLRQSIPEVTSALLEDHEIVLQKAGPQPTRRAAVIGFSGDLVKGSLGLAVEPELLEFAHARLMGRSPNARESDDFLSELSNQLLGRIKTVFLRYGVEIYLSTPMVLRGINISVSPGPHSNLVPAHFSTFVGPVSVWIDAQHAPELDVHEVEQAEDVMVEGELMFF
ncbi:MAG: chemotaxis protein CheX [Myxococcota bacterium]|nr:chemotaxis protein CheX [Myxococcota bacterium]